MKVREMTTTDVPAVHTMGQGESNFKTIPTDAFWSIDQLTRWVEANEDVLLVAEEAGHIVGFLLTTHHRPTGKVTWENVYVDPAHRGRGITKMLVAAMYIRLTDNGAVRVHGLAKVSNAEMRKILKGLGFTEGDTVIWFDRTIAVS